MGEPQPYEWSYEKRPFESNDQFLTFSVGVFQWVPKTSGKGLKKSKTIRVKGYMAAPDAVYRKAKELCDRLNKARVRAESPPSWLQSQYSVPKPDGLVIERSPYARRREWLRREWLRIRRSVIAKAGFVPGANNNNWKETDTLLLGLQMQRTTGSCEFNLGVHPAGIDTIWTFEDHSPPLFPMQMALNERYGILVRRHKRQGIARLSDNNHGGIWSDKEEPESDLPDDRGDSDRGTKSIHKEHLPADSSFQLARKASTDSLGSPSAPHRLELGGPGRPADDEDERADLAIDLWEEVTQSLAFLAECEVHFASASSWFELYPPEFLFKAENEEEEARRSLWFSADDGDLAYVLCRLAAREGHRGLSLRYAEAGLQDLRQALARGQTRGNSVPGHIRIFERCRKDACR